MNLEIRTILLNTDSNSKVLQIRVGIGGLPYAVPRSWLGAAAGGGADTLCHELQLWKTLQRGHELGRWAVRLRSCADRATKQCVRHGACENSLRKVLHIFAGRVQVTRNTIVLTIP